MKKFKKYAVLLIGAVLVLAGCSMNSDTHEHTFATEWSSDATNHWHAATCEHKGEVKDKAEHTWDGGVVTKTATENETGVKTYTCTVCGYKKTVTDEGSKIPAGFVKVTAGTFSMGSEKGFDDNKHVHSVTLTKDFLM